ncbi:Tol-Pal system beta propeller repeat protein TolB [Methylophilaceae bacterium]|mgnify:CR=1 FL=1|nr:Tol-Pal system beta propeller repeat protein TolB [Methylophilaceae bacterium]
MIFNMKIMQNYIYRFIFLVTLIILSFPSNSIEVIEILGGKASQIPIAITPFNEDLKNDDLGKMHKVIANDLERSGLFSALDTSGISNIPDSDMYINFSNWSALQAQFLIVGKSTTIRDRLTTRWSLIDIYKEKTVLSMEFSGSKKQYRAIAHKISDLVYEKLTGSPGVFHTRIIFVKKKSDKNYGLYVSDYDGFNQRAVVNSSQPIISPRWSPDGKKIAYVSFEKKKPVIYVQDLTTGKRVLVANFKGNNSAPAWSPDSKKLAIVLTYSANSQIYIINSDGSGIKQLMRTRSINTEPAWSPDGKEIFFSSDRGGNPQIYKVNVDGVSEVNRVTFEGKGNLSPSLSPDGKLLLFLTQENGKFRVAVQNLTSNQVLKLTKGPHDESPIFSPNGHMILFTYKDYGKKTKIGTVSVNGLKVTPIRVGSETIQESSWGPITN